MKAEVFELVFTVLGPYCFSLEAASLSLSPFVLHDNCFKASSALRCQKLAKRSDLFSKCNCGINLSIWKDKQRYVDMQRQCRWNVTAYDLLEMKTMIYQY